MNICLVKRARTTDKWYNVYVFIATIDPTMICTISVGEFAKSALLTIIQVPIVVFSPATVAGQICLSVAAAVASLAVTLAYINVVCPEILSVGIALSICVPFYCCWMTAVIVSSLIGSLCHVTCSGVTDVRMFAK